MFPSLLPLLRCPHCRPGAGRLSGEAWREAAGGEWIDGLLRCDDCSRWFRVEDGVADLVRDPLREHADERAFLARHAERAAGILASLAPAPEPDTESRKVLEEGRHWGAFMRRFWDVGDRSIFDIRAKGTHPPFFIAGVLEPDDRDLYRRWGIFPPRTGEVLFAWMGEFAGRHGIDVGCGGGQFGLEAARQGVAMVGLDPAWEALVLARRHARATGAPGIDYVRGEPAAPPFATGVFDLMLAKDSLHHVPDLSGVMVGLKGLLAPGGWLAIHEHVAKPRLKGMLMQRIVPPAVAKIRRRYPSVAVPAELLRDSDNEDVSMEVIRGVVAESFAPERTAEDLYLANDLEMFVHFAYGKRRWFSRLAYGAGWVLERVLLVLGDRQHWTFIGRVRA